MFKIRRRIAMWAAIVVGLPALARALHGAAQALEFRRGTSPATRNLHRAGNVAYALHGNLRGGGRRRARRR
jgi:hypothetical protein